MEILVKITYKPALVDNCLFLVVEIAIFLSALSTEPMLQGGVVNHASIGLLAPGAYTNRSLQRSIQIASLIFNIPVLH